MRQAGKAGSAREAMVVLREVARAVLATVDHTPAGAALVFDEHLRVVEAGGAAAARYGWDGELMKGRALDDVLASAEFARIMQHCVAALGGRTSHAELPTADHSAVFMCDFSPVRDGEGQVVGGLAVARDRAPDDVTPAPDDATEPGALTRRERTVLALAAQGLTTVEIASELVLAPSTIESHIRRACSRIRARNRAHAVTLALATGQLELDALALGVARRQTAEDEEKGTTVFGLSPLPIAVLDSEGLIVRANPAFERVLGRPATELLGIDAFSLLHPDDFAATRAAFDGLLRGDETEVFDVAARHDYEGGWRWMAWSAGRAPDGQSVLAIGRELLDAAELEERTHRPAATLIQEIALEAPLAIFIKDTESRYLYANRFADSQFGMGPGGLAGLLDTDFLPADIAERFMANDRRALEEGAVVQREDIIDNMGRRRLFVTAKFPVHDHTGRPQAIAGISVEITDEADKISS